MENVAITNKNTDQFIKQLEEILLCFGILALFSVNCVIRIYNEK